MTTLSLTSSEARHLLKKHGSITYKGICDLKGIAPEKKQVVKVKKERCNKVGEMKLLLRLAGIEYEEEVKFHASRKWRFDISIKGTMIACEYEGIYGQGKSRHTTKTGYANDAEKYREAAKLGWTVLRYTAIDFVKVVDDVRKIIETNLNQK